MSGVDKYAMREFMNLLTEARTAPLYHGTELATGLMILQSGFIQASQDYDYPDDPVGVSTSRSGRFALSWGGSREDTGHGIVFALDQAKLATRYRIVPHVAVSARGDRIEGEEEEVVAGTITPLSTYLLSVNVDASKLAQLIAGGDVFDRWLRSVGDLMGYPGDEETMEMLKSLAQHPLLNRIPLR